MAAVDVGRVNALVLGKQHLRGRSRGVPLTGVVDDVVALHATGPTTPYLSLFCRMEGFSREQLDKEMYEVRSLAKVRCMRRTVHVLTRDLFPLAVRATQHLFANRLEGFETYGGMSREAYKDVAEQVMERIPDGGWTTREAKAELEVDVNLSWVLNLICDQGTLLRWRAPTGWRSNTHRYVPMNVHFPGLAVDVIDEDEAKAVLVRRYLTAFGPATMKDVAWWTGFRITDAKRAVSRLDEMVTFVEVDSLDGEHIVVDSQVDGLESMDPGRRRVVNLLPLQDPYMVGYNERDRYLDPERKYQVLDKAGNPTSCILVNGRVEGVWDAEGKPEPVVKVHFFQQPSRTVHRAVVREAHRVGAFVYGTEVKVRDIDTMVPLDERTMGSFMHPLKDQ